MSNFTMTLENKSEIRIFSWFLLWFLVIVTGVLFVGTQRTLWKIQSLEPYMLHGPPDAWQHNAFALEKIKSSTHSENQRRILLVGGSICLEAVSSDDDVSRKISTKSGYSN